MACRLRHRPLLRVDVFQAVKSVLHLSSSNSRALHPSQPILAIQDADIDDSSSLSVDLKELLVAWNKVLPRGAAQDVRCILSPKIPRRVEYTLRISFNKPLVRYQDEVHELRVRVEWYGEMCIVSIA